MKKLNKIMPEIIKVGEYYLCDAKNEWNEHHALAMHIIKADDKFYYLEKHFFGDNGKIQPEAKCSYKIKKERIAERWQATEKHHLRISLGGISKTTIVNKTYKYQLIARIY